MAKSKSKRKQQALLMNSKSKKIKIASPPSPPFDDTPLQSLWAVISPAELEVTVDTLDTLARHPTLIKSKECKDVRAAVYDFRQACTTGSNAAGDPNLTARISGALADGRYLEARVLLAEMRVRGQSPRLGALCRWVRDLDVVSGLAQQLDGTGPGRTAAQAQLLAVLDSILRVVGPIDYTSGDQTNAAPILPKEAWNLRDNATRRMVYNSVLDGSIFASTAAGSASRFRVIDTTPGVQRKPPNHHPAVLYASEDNAIALSPRHEATRHNHPVVPNLHLLKNVLSPPECEQIIAAAEAIGFTPDAPIRPQEAESSILAHNFYWIVDGAFNSALWSRVVHLIPSTVNGKQVRGLNRRFRVYRYVPGAEYRAHIDGAWPPSGINSIDDSYIYDSSPPASKQSSLFTFLIYLNDEFEGGETTFFLPSAKEGCISAYPVKPIQGTVLMFPHGETDGSLLHEGTGVRTVGFKPSAKYVIRTDVEYDILPTE